MSIPTNHHFVPKVYLKEFANSQKQIFQRSKERNHIASKNISQICYKPNYFKLHQKGNLFLSKIKDQNHIEKNVFRKQENLYLKLLKKLTFSSLLLPNLSKSEVTLLLETLITIKRRNPIYRKQVIQDFKEHVTSEQFRKDAEIGFEISKKIDNIDPIAYFENYVREVTTNEDKHSDIYLQGFVDTENKTVSNVAKTLMNYKIFVYHAPEGSEFITSDNPGFTMLPDGTLYSYGAFGLQFTFIFPLTPKCCLFITHGQLEIDRYSFKKDIHIAKADKNFVNEVNQATYLLAIDKVFSYSKNTLLNLLI